MYEPGIKYWRKPEEKANQFLSWKRNDKAFFASGACHILAFTFTYLHPDKNLALIHIKPKGKFSGNQVYAIDGE